jgi:intracellular multiplication protein IcmL
MASPRIDQAALYYRDNSQNVIYVLIFLMVVLLFMGGLVLAQVLHRPIPQFAARRPNGQIMMLQTYEEPNLSSKTILSWASQAAVAAYTFNFANYSKTIPLARPYFTPGGWQAYQNAINPVVQSITKAQLIVQGVVSGAAVIANQGPLIGHGYSWRVQIPFLSKRYFVIMNIVKIPTTTNPQGIGIDTYEMR